MPRRLPDLKPRQLKFIDEFLETGNGTQSAIKAGYGKSGADVQAVRLLANARVKAIIEQRQAKAAARVDVDLAEWLKNVKELAFAEKTRDNARAQGLTLLGKYKKWLTDRMEHTGADGGAIPIQIVLPAKDDK